MKEIIVVANQKGGVGKTTVAMMLTVMSANKKKKVIVVDTNAQFSASAFFLQREKNAALKTGGIKFFQETHPVIHKELPDMDFEIAVIDTAYDNLDVMRSALRIATRVIVPVTPGDMELWSLEKFLKDLAGHIGKYDIDPAVGVVLNRINPSTNIGSDMMETLEEIVKEWEIYLFLSDLKDRVIYSELPRHGAVISEAHLVINDQGKKLFKKGKYAQAQAEARKFYLEFKRWINEKIG